MTPRGRAALVLGFFLLVGTILATTATVYAGQHDCGSAISAHVPQGKFIGKGTESLAEDQCNRKVTDRRYFVVLIGAVGVVVSMAGAFDHDRSSRARGPK
jgi:hypothetical protein